jgi:ribosomal-protein-alanine N-acetyltransferase
MPTNPVAMRFERETQRLLLRPYRHEDWRDIHRYASLPDFSRYDVWGPNSAEDTKAFVAFCIAQLAAVPISRYDFAVAVKPDGVVIGGCTLKLDDGDGSAAGLGYAINPAYQGRGFATEVASALIGFAFAELDLSEVYAECDTRNLASRRVMEKVGMQLVTVILRHQEIRGIMTDTYRYAIRRDGKAPEPELTVDAQV